jgi:hypothetical protein
MLRHQNVFGRTASTPVDSTNSVESFTSNYCCTDKSFMQIVITKFMLLLFPYKIRLCDNNYQ